MNLVHTLTDASIIDDILAVAARENAHARQHLTEELATACVCSDCGGRKTVSVPHAFGCECSGNRDGALGDAGCQQSEIEDCVACDGTGAASWHPEEVREARAVALQLEQLGDADALSRLAASVQRSTAASLISPSQAAECGGIAIGWVK